MSTPTFYTALGLLPTASPEIIRAVYKALCLISHPDKTINLAPQARAEHAAAFNQIQAAYDVLGSPSLKAAYDSELARSDSVTDARRTAFHQTPSYSSSKNSWSSKEKTAVKLTTPEEKSAARARARQSLENFRKLRAEREVEDSKADMASLKHKIEIWTELADENRDDPAMRAHCAIRIHEYEQKVVHQNQQHDEWLAKISIAKQSSQAATTKAKTGLPKKTAQSGLKAAEYKLKTPPSSPTARILSPVHSPTPKHRNSRTEQRKKAQADRQAAAAARAEARALEKAQREAAKQVHLDQKAAAVRAEKAKQEARIQQQALEESQRIAKARAKAGAAPLGTVGSVVGTVGTVSDETAKVFSRPLTEKTAPTVASSGSKQCSKCGLVHSNFREWRACNSSASTLQNQKGGYLFQPE